MERSAGTCRVPALGEGRCDGGAHVAREHSSTRRPEPVAGVRLVRGDDEDRAGVVCVLHCVRARPGAEGLVVRRPAAQAPAVSRAVDDDESRALAVECHSVPPCPVLAAMLAGQRVGESRLSGRLWAVRGRSVVTNGDRQ